MPQRRTLLFVVAALAAITRTTVAADTDTTAPTSTSTPTSPSNTTTTITPPLSFVPFTWLLDDTDALLHYEDASAWVTNGTFGLEYTSTSSSGASLSFSFVGTEIAILGTSDPSTGLLWTVDGNVTELGPSSAPSDSSVASTSPVIVDARVPIGYHTVKLQLLGGQVSVTGINITTGLYAQA